MNDALLENQTVESFEQSNAPKGIATKILDEISREKCKNLQYFVVFSSISCGQGNAGQSNYGMVNSVMERIVENRKRVNLPAKAIQWGPIGDVGMFTKIFTDQQLMQDIQIQGTLMQSICSCLEVLDTLLTSKESIITCFVVAEKHNTNHGRAALFQRLLKYMGIKDIAAYPKDTKIVDFGLDSLLTVEIIHYAERELNVKNIYDFRSL